MIVPIDEPTVSFKSHIKNIENKHILFSGPFGYGKTYFLKEFFKNNSTNYSTFFISPVKYSVSPNEDIFDYIKIDLSVSIILSDKLPITTKPFFSEKEYLQNFLYNYQSEAFSILFEALSSSEIESAKKTINILSKINEIKSKYYDFKNSINNTNKSIQEKLKNLIEQHTIKRGSIFEDDASTQLIRGSVETIKKITNTETVLIIDDLDRLDPEHIFRILNIFSAHNNYYGTENKFGFDKIIIVCSLPNLRNIYRYKYGEKVDFNGYIEKFYSTEVFYFNNQLAISSFCRSEFKTEIDKHSQSFLSYILTYFSKNDIISVRSIIKYRKAAMFDDYNIVFDINDFYENISSEEVTPSTNTYSRSYTVNDNVWREDFKNPIKNGTKTIVISTNDLPILKVLKILITIFGDYTNLLEAIDIGEKDEQEIDEYYVKDLIKSLAPLENIITNYKNPEKIMYESFRKESSHYMNRKFTEYTKPVVSLHQIFSTKINVKWNSENQYDSTKSFYSNIDYEGWNINYPVNDKKLTVKDLLYWTKTIITKLDRLGHLQKIGITKK